MKTLAETDSRITTDEPNSLTGEELERFLKAAQEYRPQDYAMILTLVTTGMRMSAARALRWEDIDPEEGIITVRRRVSAGEIVPGVKRDRKGVDRVPLLPELQTALEEHKVQLNEDQIESGLVFPTTIGTVRDRVTLKKPFDVILKHAKITKRFTPHGLRRTANDLFRQVTSEVVTKAITGHTTSRMHEHYSTVRGEEKLAAAQAAFGGLIPDQEQGEQGPQDQTGCSTGCQGAGEKKRSHLRLVKE